MAETGIKETTMAAWQQLIDRCKKRWSNPRPRTRPKRKKRSITIFSLIRPLLAVVAALVIWQQGYPVLQEVIDQDYASQAISKGRVLLRGAQEVATKQLLAGTSWVDTEAYLCRTGSLPEILQEGRFEVTPISIDQVKLDERGRIQAMTCVLENNYRRYRVEMDLTQDRYTPQLLEKLERPEEERGLGFFIKKEELDKLIKRDF